MGARRLGLLFLVLVLVATASPAHASLWIEFEPPRGAPGTLVEGHTMGDGAFQSGEARTMPAFIYPTVGGDNRVPIGHVRIGPHGNGTLTFQVPDVPPGKYSILVICEECAPYSADMTEILVGELRVLGDGTRDIPMVPPAPEQWDVLGTVVLGGLIVIVVVVNVRRGRARARRPSF